MLLEGIVGVAFVLALGMVAALVYLIRKNTKDQATLRDMQDLYEQGELIQKLVSDNNSWVRELAVAFRQLPVTPVSAGGDSNNGNGHKPKETNFLDAVADLQKQQTPQPIDDGQPENILTPDQQKLSRSEKMKVYWQVKRAAGSK